MSTPHAKTAKIVGKDELSHLVAAKAQVDVKEADAMLDAFMETTRTSRKRASGASHWLWLPEIESGCSTHDHIDPW